MAMHFLSVFCVALSVLVASQQGLAVNPGFRIAITDKGLNYILTVGIPILQEALSTTTIPDQSGKASTPIGSIKYSLSNIKLGPLSIPTSSLTPGEKGLQLKASGISVKAHADWHYKEESFPHISDSGSCDISVSSVTLSVTVTLGEDSGGHPTLAAAGCSLGIGHLDITFHGGASWLYNLFADNIADGLKGSLQDQLCKEAVTEINTDGNKALETLPVEVKIDDYAVVNYQLVESPTLTSAYIETNHKGEFMSAVKPVEVPVTPPAALPAISKTDKMVYVWFTDYVADTAGYVYQAAGKLAYNVTPDMIPSSSPIQLNTSSFKLILPSLYKTYPNMAMFLDLQASKPPTMVMSASSINLTVPANVNVSVLDPSTKATKPAFTVGLVVFCDVTVTVKAKGAKELVVGNANFLRAEISLISTNIGNFNVGLLQSAANLLSQSVVVPLINQYVNPGIEIPMFEGVSFLNANITLGDHFIVVSSDINYKPTFLVRDG